MKETNISRGRSRKAEASLVDVLHALADPVRLEIVRQLSEVGEKACGTFGIDRPKSSMSHHFNVLRRAGVIESEGKGAFLMNRLRKTELEQSYPGVLSSIVKRIAQGKSRKMGG